MKQNEAVVLQANNKDNVERYLGLRQHQFEETKKERKVTYRIMLLKEYKLYPDPNNLFFDRMFWN